ncbi:glutamine amidotransferase family protein [Faecalispora jeddahensis]|uniref:class II glutamine amidotransferase n=1 Tax=Faecalispora jeddahensis TaxID=1414721 RepID=UPI0027B8BA68|nr:glutamine amidotransferase family protein [Faecalispora jeddahensis]
MLKEGQIRIPSGCAISGIFSRNGRRLGGEKIIESIETMRVRSNGLGGGFAAYGIYPEHKECYALHVFYDNETAKEAAEKLLLKYFEISVSEKIPTRPIPQITDAPIIWRYFAVPAPHFLQDKELEEKELVVECVFKINADIAGAYVFSCGKNMGVFKAVGYPEDVGRYYRLEEYEGYSWTAHGRYPTNTPGWWGGAHPFALLDYTIVHNGEISSYDANRRFIEMYGYKCALLTDTEVITYMIDYLHRRKQLTLPEVADVIAAPFWEEIDRMPEDRRRYYTYLRNIFSDLLITGPFSILLGFEGGIMALNDRLKLRSLVAAEKDDMVYIASEECAIRAIEPNLDHIFAPKYGEPVIYTLNKEAQL